MPASARPLVVEDLKLHLSRTHLGIDNLLGFYGIKKSTYYGWFNDAGELLDPKPRAPVNDRKILPAEITAVIEYRKRHPDIGYRKLAWQMIDENVAAISESAVYSILSEHNMLTGWAATPGAPAGKEYQHKPKFTHHHWHTDIAY